MSADPFPRDTEMDTARIAAAQAIRDLSHTFVGRHATIDQLERLTTVLEGITAELWPAQVRNRRDDPAVAPHESEYPQGRFEHGFDDRPVSGKASPYGLDLELHRHGDEIEALVTLRAAHEGAPDRSHGGIVAALFDDVFGFVLGVLRQPAFTGDLYIRYAAPTPLHRQLSCRVRLAERQGRKLIMTGELNDVRSGDVLATATATFIAVDSVMFSKQTAERPAPPDEDS
jgi:acyl-coenzyme A thioesterase PaaI-like protein